MRSLLVLCGLLALSVAVLIIRSRRRRWRPDFDSFPCRIRALGDAPADWPRLRRRWPYGRMRGRWVGDALQVRYGPFHRCVTLPARVGMAGVRTAARRTVRLCGRHPITVELEISDGTRVEVAACDTERFELVGPYLAAATTGLPPAPVPWPKHRDCDS